VVRVAAEVTRAIGLFAAPPEPRNPFLAVVMNVAVGTGDAVPTCAPAGVTAMKPKDPRTPVPDTYATSYRMGTTFTPDPDGFHRENAIVVEVLIGRANPAAAVVTWKTRPDEARV
jgi:hypothetical protein